MEDEQNFWIEEVNNSLREWRQGDYTLGEHWFIQRYNPERPLTIESKESQKIAIERQEENDILEDDVPGFVVITQTCDIVRPCEKRPYIEISPLFEVDEQDLEKIKKGRIIQYAYIPKLWNKKLVANLDRVMTVEKAVMAKWDHHQGCNNDEEVRAFAQALARKRVRFAFPDDFNEFVGKLQKRIKKKHNKLSNEGEALRALREIRVRASPSWKDPEIELMFWFIREPEQIDFQNKGWDEYKKEWEQLIIKKGRFKQVYSSVTTLEDMNANEYVESDRLDLDYLSS